ncbi:MAG: class I SAM-dependent methyltransferase [Thermoanaerobaculia bacterium]
MAEEKFIETPPAGLEGWREVWRENRRHATGGSGPAARLLALVRKVMRAIGRADEARQRDFNLALLEMIEDRSRDVAAVRVELESARGELETLLRTAVGRNDALLLAIDAKVETALARIRDLALPRAERPRDLPERDEWLYRRLEEGLRGTEAEVRESLSFYLDRARQSQPVIDVGCGRGEFLELCRAAGVEARGFDTNTISVADLEARGLTVSAVAIPECFRGMADASVGSIFASHVVEHLPIEPLIDLFSEARRVLQPGGYLMIETPNAEAIAVSASDFWRDPTHLAPRHLAALTLLAREYGFAVEEAGAVHPFPSARRLRLSSEAGEDVRALAAQLDAILFGSQDLRLILRK